MSELEPILRKAFRDAPQLLKRIDLDVYQRYERDPHEPLIGLGGEKNRLALFGRDPGRDEVRYWEPFIGAGGQQVRRVLYRQFHGEELPDFQASMAIGRRVFWLNTVPYKPIGNKVWPKRDQRRFQPLMRRVLLECWQGRDIITLGRDAFFWFGLGETREAREKLEHHWARPDRFETSLSWHWEQGAPDHEVRLHPLPHPSPLNATWYRKFPNLLAQRLIQLDWGGHHWQLDP